MRTKAPTLAWLLTALTCFLAGMAVAEVRQQAAAPPVAVVATATVAVELTPTAEPTPLLTPTPAPTPTPTKVWESS